MKKSELVAKMAEGAGLTKAQAEKALASFIAGVTGALTAGDKVTLVGFGTFSAITRKARTGATLRPQGYQDSSKNVWQIFTWQGPEDLACKKAACKTKKK